MNSSGGIFCRRRATQWSGGQKGRRQSRSYNMHSSLWTHCRGRKMLHEHVCGTIPPSGTSNMKCLPRPTPIFHLANSTFLRQRHSKGSGRLLDCFRGRSMCRLTNTSLRTRIITASCGMENGMELPVERNTHTLQSVCSGLSSNHC